MNIEEKIILKINKMNMNQLIRQRNYYTSKIQINRRLIQTEQNLKRLVMNRIDELQQRILNNENELRRLMFLENELINNRQRQFGSVVHIHNQIQYYRDLINQQDQQIRELLNEMNNYEQNIYRYEEEIRASIMNIEEINEEIEELSRPPVEFKYTVLKK